MDRDTQNFIRLTPDTWSEPDPTSTQFCRMDHRGNVAKLMTGDDWAAEFLGVQLGDHVPDDIVDLFDVAKGMLCFGWFFYPMFAAGEDQLHRVAEAAAKLRYRDVTGKAPPTFEKTIKQLIALQVIPFDQEARWGAARYLRNRGSHRTQHVANLPGPILQTLEVTAADIDALFRTGEDMTSLG